MAGLALCHSTANGVILDRATHARFLCESAAVFSFLAVHFVNSGLLCRLSGSMWAISSLWCVFILPASYSDPSSDMFVLCLADGQRILSCGADNFMRVLDVATAVEVYAKDTRENLK